jgi:DNA repair exonuclease SbcCD nuclease subunit
VAEHWLCLHQALGELSHQQHSDLSATQVPTWVNRTFLGDFHDHLVHIDTKNRSFIYPGSIETVSFNQEKTPGFLIWDVPTAKYVHISTQQREYLTFKLTIETMDKWEEQLRKRMEESHQTFKKKPIVQIAYPAGTYIEYQRIKPLVEGSCLKLFDHEYALVAPVAKAEGEAVEIAPNASREDITRAAVEMLHQRPDDAVAQDAAAILANPDHVDTIRAGRYPKTVLRKSTQS